MKLKTKKIIISLVFWASFIGVWHAYSLQVPAYQLPGPGSVAKTILAIVSDASMSRQIILSLIHISCAMVVAFIVGSFVALLPNLHPASAHFVDHRLTPFLNSFSGVGWLFIAILWFGINSFTVIFAVTMVLIPFAIINLRTGLSEMDAEIIELGASLTRTKWKNFCKIVIPMLYPYAFATLRISFGVSWKVVLTAELFGGSGGMGYMLNKARQEFETEIIFALITCMIIFVIASELLVFQRIQRGLDKRYHVE
ncbi:ABC transporter permease subunit [Alphaproteobacteria bacterium]|nr:ABC transporter permease subunit [Alphaproteobacteria bacterium]